jgi:hypothetical protein
VIDGAALVVAPIASSLESVAAAFTREAQLQLEVGGSHARVIAWEHDRAAQQLLAIRQLVQAHPVADIVDVAHDYLAAARVQLDTIRRTA